jgi:hypothetical protein
MEALSLVFIIGTKMAHLHTDIVPVNLKVSVSRLVKGGTIVADLAPEAQEQIQQLVIALLMENTLAQVAEQLEAFVRELLGDNGLIVEIEQN